MPNGYSLPRCKGDMVFDVIAPGIRLRITPRSAIAIKRRGMSKQTQGEPGYRVKHVGEEGECFRSIVTGAGCKRHM
jgi:hypothetical protein